MRFDLQPTSRNAKQTSCSDFQPTGQQIQKFRAEMHLDTPADFKEICNQNISGASPLPIFPPKKINAENRRRYLFTS
jgi:hypothetical protein